MKAQTKITISLVCFMFLSSCRSIWQQPVPDGEIVYQGEGFLNSSGHKLGFVQADGKNNQVLELNRQFDKPVWSKDGEFLYGLTGASGSYMGYPAYWDLQRGRFGFCKRNLPYYEQIQGSDNLENPYEVIVQDVWTIVVIDISKCKQVQVLVDYSARPGDFSIAGFSYSSSTKVLVYGLVNEPNRDREYKLIRLNLKTNEQVQIAEGINPSWSPDGVHIAYIGLDGLYTLALDAGEPNQLIDKPYFDPWGNGSPWADVSIPYWSPDGEWLIYHRCNTVKVCTWKDAQIFKIRSEGGQEETILAGGEYPNWGP